MAKYSDLDDRSQSKIIGNELAEMNRLKRIELDIRMFELVGGIQKEDAIRFRALYKMDGA